MYSERGRCLLSLMLTLLCLLLILCTDWTYPGSDAHSQQARDKQIFIWPIAGTSDITTLDPALNSDGYSSQAIQMVFTGLVQLNNKLEVEPQLAQSYAREPTANGFIWTFRLRPHLTFSDGTALTAHDVIWSIDRALQPETGSGVAMLYLGLIKDAEKLDSGNVQTLIGDSLFAPDPMTVKIITTTKAQYFLNALTYPTSYVVNPRLIKRYKEAWTEHIQEGGGAGPFQISSYTHTRNIHFIVNPHYYGPHPRLHEVIMPFYPSSEALYQAYQNNQVSYAPISTADQARARAANGTQLHRTQLLWTQYIAFNYLARPFDNVKFRQAFALALDKIQLAHSVNKDALMPTNHILPQGLPEYNPHVLGPAGVQSLHGDRQKAQQLFNEGLKEEGLTRQTLPPLRLTSAYTTARRKQNIEAIRQQWNTVLNIHVELDHISFASFQAAIPATRHNPHGLMMWEDSWVANVADPHDWTTVLFGREARANNWNYGQNTSRETLAQQNNQRLMLKADTETDNNKRTQLYQQAEQQLIEEVAWLPEGQLTSMVVLKPCVQGFPFNALGIVVPNDWAGISISTKQSCSNPQ